MHFTASYPIMMFCMYFGRSLLILLKDVKMSLLTCGCSNFSSVWCCERWFYDTVMPLARRCKGPESLQLKDKFLGRSSRPLRPSELQRNSLFCTKVIEMASKLGIDKAQLPRKRIHPKVEQKKVNSWQLLKIGFNKTEFATVVEGCHSEVVFRISVDSLHNSAAGMSAWYTVIYCQAVSLVHNSMLSL